MATDDYRTDKWLSNVFSGWYDPCPFKADFDGLLEDWRINTYVNPPYSNPKPWVRKAIRENRSYGATIVLLLKMDSSTQWFQELQEAGAHFLWVNKRLKFRTNKTAPFPSMLAILEGHDKIDKKQVRIIETESEIIIQEVK